MSCNGITSGTVKKSYWDKPALFPRSARFLGRRAKGLLVEGGYLMAAATLFLIGQLYVAPNSSPMTFEKVVGQVQSLEEVGKKNIPTMVVMNGDVESTFKRIGEDWSELVVDGDQKSLKEISSSCNTAIEKVYSEDKADIIPASERYVQISTWLPRLK